MVRLVKWLLGALVTLVVLILAAVVIGPMVFDPNDYRSDISELVKEQTGRDLTLDGELKLSVFPWLGIRTEGLSLSQPSEIGGDMVSVDTAQLRVKLGPLLSKQVHVDTVILKEPKFRLVTLANGIDSFSGLVSDDEAETAESASEESAGAAVALLIQGVELTGGEVVIDDRAAGTLSEINNLSLETGNLIGSSLAPLKASGRFKTSDSPDIVQFEMDGSAKIDVDTLLVELADLQVQVQQAENDIRLEVSSLTLVDQAKISLTGLQVTTQGIADVSLRAPTISANLDSQRADVPELNLQVGDLKASLTDFIARDFIDAPKASASLSVPSFNAAQLIKDFDVDYQTNDPKALTAVALSADFAGSLDGAEINNLNLQLDDTSLKGSASVKNFEKPAANFDLVLDALDVDRYLPPTDESEEVEDDGVSGAEALAVPMAAFKEIQANGQFKATTLISGGVELNNIDVQVRSEPGKVTITPTASLYDGSLAGQIAFTDQNGVSKLAVKNEVDLVQLGNLLNAADVTGQLSGIGSVLIDLVVTEVNGKQSNQGVVKLLAKDGAVKGVDVKGLIDSAYAKYQSLSGKEPTADESGSSDTNDETKFAELVGTFNINDNVITNDDFSLKAPLFRINGEGTIDVERETLDYLVEVKLVASTSGQGGESYDKLAGIPIPVRFSGNFEAPNYSIDFKRIYQALFKRQVEEKKGQYLQEKLGIEGGEKLSTKEVLKGFLGSKIDKKLNKGKAEGQERELTERGESSAGDASNAGDSAASEPQKSEKDKLKDDLKNKLLDGLFGK